MLREWWVKKETTGWLKDSSRMRNYALLWNKLTVRNFKKVYKYSSCSQQALIRRYVLTNCIETSCSHENEILCKNEMKLKNKSNQLKITMALVLSIITAHKWQKIKKKFSLNTGKKWEKLWERRDKIKSEGPTSA